MKICNTLYQKYEDEVQVKQNQKGNYVFVFKCKGSAHDNGTSNLLRHFNVCSAEKQVAGPKQTKLTETYSKYTDGEFRLLIAEWLTQCHRPDSIVNDKPLIALFYFLNPKIHVFSSKTARRDIKEIFTVSHQNLKKLLASHQGRFNLGFDGWTAPNWLEFLGVQVTFVHNADLLLITLDLVELTGHDGETMANLIAQCLEDFGILDRSTGDNASTNDKMLDFLELKFGWDSLAGRTTQALMSQFEPKKVPKSQNVEEDVNDVDNLPDPEMNDEDDGDDDSEEEVDIEPGHELREAARQAAQQEVEEMAGERPEVQVLTDEERRLGTIAVKKVIKLCSRIWRSGKLQKQLRAHFQDQGLKPVKVVKRAKHRWNTMSKVVKRVLIARRPLNALCRMPEHAKGRPSARLRPLLLNDEEWRVIEELEPILILLERTTEEVSKRNILPCVRAAVAGAIAVLDKYYSKTDESIMWKTAMLLHPRYKVFYFRDQLWEEEWIDTAVKTAREVWQKHYKIHVTAVARANDDDDDPLAAVANYGLNTDEDAFEAYIGAPRDASVVD
ncbi:hypothetical protein MPER_12997, partial [Moniliophthora perniciosa FA553]